MGFLHQIQTRPALWGQARSCMFCLGSPAPAGFCPACYKDLPFIKKSCLLCALPLPSDSGHWQELCVSCQKKPPPPDYTFAALHYRAPLRRALHELKFRRQLRYARALGNIWLQSLLTDSRGFAGEEDRPDLLLPVPLHPVKLGQRGFNPSYELARPLAEFLKVPLAVQTSRRIKNTEPQLKLSPSQRRRNLKGAFEVNPKDVRGKYVVILDDVITSGATVYELARTLRRKGARRIAAWSLLRA